MKKSQTELVQQDLDTLPREVTDVLHIPGIEKLHLKGVDEIAATLANVIKSRAGISKFTWDLKRGQIEITCDANPHRQLLG